MGPRAEINTPHRPAEPPGLGPATWWTVAALAAVRLAIVLFGPYNLSPDEAYFWEWSRHPAFGYYDQGPMVAWAIRAFTLLLGDTEPGVRAGALAMGSATLLLLASLVRRLGGSRRAGCLAVLAVSLTPLGQLNAIVMTYYLPQLVLWALVMHTLWELRGGAGDTAARGAATAPAHGADRPAGAPRAWLALGLWLGLGGLTHHTFLWLGLVAAAWLIATPATRRAFTGPWPYVAALVAVAVVSPYLAWNAQHDWVGLRHALGLVRVETPTWRGIRWGGVAYYVEGQFAVLTPVYFASALVAIGSAAARARRDDGARLLALGTWPLFAYVATLAFAGRSEANWTSAATLGLAAAWALRVDAAWARRGWMPLVVPAALGTALALTLAAHGAPLFWSLGGDASRPDRDPLHRLHGWRRLGEEVYAARRALAGPTPAVAATVDDYAIPAELSFYAPDHAPTWCPPIGRRHHQYDFWAPGAPPPGGSAVWVTRSPLAGDDPVRGLFRVWSAAREVPIVEPWTGVVRRRFYLYECRGFLGVPQDRLREF
ncbi:MAG: glycosyltransferase family 39 protein [Candidatus Eisenbacteria bacterium]|nr:glycosyltransferase family 39 protein [Candidatus Eisenbacteria bacterium]